MPNSVDTPAPRRDAGAPIAKQHAALLDWLDSRSANIPSHADRSGNSNSKVCSLREAFAAQGLAIQSAHDRLPHLHKVMTVAQLLRT